MTEEYDMNKNRLGKVLALYITKQGDPARVTKNSVNLDENGVQGDKFYAKDLQRSVLVASKDSYDIAEHNNIVIDQGTLGENILIDWNPYHLLPGEQFTIGDVTFEVTQNCTLCKGLSNVNTKLPKLLKNDRGIFVKVIHSGTINIGDNIQVVID